MMTPTLNILLSVAAIYFVQRITATPCPQVAIWESTYSMVGYQRNFSAFVWVRPTDNQYVVTCNPSCSGTSTYSATYNDTHSTLTVGSISVNDSGLWRIKDANVNIYTPICHLTTANLPTCDISSDLDPLSLELGTVLSITVNIKDYSCSDQAGFDLTTGDVTETLLRNDNAKLNTNEVLNSTVNVTLTRLGDVRLNFTCLNTSWELDCGGVKQLLKSPPSCNISSDVETDDLELGTEVTLSVDIRNYYCSKQAEFNLTTGSAKEVLLATHDVDDISSAFPNTTFNATDERFGKVLVKFSCDNYNEDLICGGIKELVKTTPCPQVAIWESTYSMVGYQRNFSAYVWVRPTDNQYVVTCNPSCSGTSTYSATYNDTHSTLTVGRISVNDSGLWRIRDANVDIYTSICHLTTANLPTCNISSDLDPLSLELGTVLSITVNIKNYACSDQAGFDLTTGDVTETLLRNDNAKLNTNEVLNSTVNVTLTRLGDVRLNFTCLNTSWELDCGGVKQLLKSPPSCNISSDVETDDLELGTEVTLSVDIRNYYCSKQAEFNLTTGSAKEVLLATHDVDDISSAFPNTTFNATDERFGKVLVKFSCDNYNEDLICGGIKELVKNTPSLTSTTTTAGSPAQDPDFPVALIAGVCAGVLVLVVIVVVVVLNRRKITAVARKYIVTRKTQRSQFEDGFDSSTSEPTLDMKDNVAFDEIKLDNVEKVADSEHD